MNSFNEVLSLLDKEYGSLENKSTDYLSDKDRAPVNPNGYILYGSMLQLDNEVFSDFVCEYIFDMAPDSSKAKQMFQDLQSGQTTKDEIIYNFAMDEAFIRGSKDILGLGIKNIPLKDLMRFDDEHYVFLKNVYLWLFGRVPDNEGFVNFLRMLEEGVPHLDLLYALSKSEEAKNREIKITGLDFAYRKARIRHILGRIKGKILGK